jgi:hypothetical protein
MLTITKSPLLLAQCSLCGDLAAQAADVRDAYDALPPRVVVCKGCGETLARVASSTHHAVETRQASPDRANRPRAVLGRRLARLRRA